MLLLCGKIIWADLSALNQTLLTLSHCSVTIWTWIRYGAKFILLKVLLWTVHSEKAPGKEEIRDVEKDIMQLLKNKNKMGSSQAMSTLIKKENREDSMFSSETSLLDRELPTQLMKFGRILNIKRFPTWFLCDSILGERERER